MNKKIITTLLLCGVCLSIAQPTYAETAKTKGEVGFEEGDNNSTGVPSLPDENNELPIKPEGGNQTKGTLRLEHVPDFKFGKQKISSASKTYKALWNEAKWADADGNPLKDPAGVEKPAFKIPAFLQITDERGTAKGYEVSVKQTVPFTSPTAGVDPLTNSYMQITEAQVFVGKKTQADVLNLVETIDPVTTGAPSKMDATGFTVVKTKTGKTTDGFQTSVVFNSAYDRMGWDDTKATGKTQSGVELVVPAGDKQVKDEVYTAELTWEIKNAP